jgi:predicted transcriptional regulator YdeE
LLQPRIVYKAGFTVVGFAHEGDISERNNDTLWGALSEHYAEIPHADPDAGFGVYTRMGSEPRYLAGLAVRENGTIPAGMTEQNFDAHIYAVFVHTGQTSGLRQTMEWILEGWLPDSAYERDGDYYFEYYDDRFQPGSRDSIVFLWVPVREKK